MEIALKAKIELPYDPPISGYVSGKNENTTLKDACISVFTAALFTAAKMWKQPNCPSADN